MKYHFLIVYILSVLFCSTVAKKAWKTLDGTRPLLISHRGEKVLAPEHTIPAYTLAAILGADYVEPDLCLTKDDQLVCHHDIYITDANTDVGSRTEFDHLKQQIAGGFRWYIQNFTVEELQTIKIFQKNVGIRPKEFNGIYSIPTFQEFLHTIHDLCNKLNRSVGIAPELKNPEYHNSNRTPNFMEDAMLKVLAQNGYSLTKDVGKENCRAMNKSIKCPPVLIQSFQLPSLEYLRSQSSFDLVMLVEDDDSLLTHEGIERVSKIANHFYVWKEILHVGREELISIHNFTYNKEAIEFLGGFVPFNELISVVHQNGMKIGIYTIYDSREESHRVKRKHETHFTKRDELYYYFSLGVDGIFVENIAETREILQDFQATKLCSSGGLRASPLHYMFLVAYLLYVVTRSI